MAAVRVDGSHALASHRPKQHVESLLEHQPPLKLQVLDHDVEVWWRWVDQLDSSAQDIPQVFDWIQILGTGRPTQPGDLLLLQEVVDDPCSMWASMVPCRVVPCLMVGRAGRAIGLRMSYLSAEPALLPWKQCRGSRDTGWSLPTPSGTTNQEDHAQELQRRGSNLVFILRREYGHF